MYIQMEAAAPGTGRSGGMISGTVDNPDSTPSAPNFQPALSVAMADATPRPQDADLLGKISKAAGMIAFTRERIEEMTTLINEALATIERAHDGAKRSVGIRGRRYHERLAIDTANEAGMLLGIHKERRHVPLEPDQIRDALVWWLNAGNAHLEVLANEAAFYLAIIGGDPAARDRIELRANDRLQQLDDYERHLYREVWT